MVYTTPRSLTLKSEGAPTSNQTFPPLQSMKLTKRKDRQVRLSERIHPSSLISCLCVYMCVWRVLYVFNFYNSTETISMFMLTCCDLSI